MKLEGRTTVITGASSGIGRCLAYEVSARRGAPVLVGRHPAALRTLAEELRLRFPDAPRPRIAPCDLSDRDGLRGALGRARSAAAPIDVLINNAGISLYGSLRRTEPEDLRALLEVNLFGPLHAILEVLPEMTARGDGLIVNVASAAGLRGVPYLAAYGASKAALAAIGQSLRAELTESGVRVLNVYPGYTRTPLFAREKRVGGARRPNGRYAAPERVARAIARAIEADARELVLTPDGKVVAALARLAPGLLDRAYARLAKRLRAPDDGHRAPAAA